MSQSVHNNESRVGLSANLRATLQRAGKYAAEQRHQLVTIEHILTALNEDPEAKIILKACSIDQTKLYNDASGYLKTLRDLNTGNNNSPPMLDTEATRIINSAVIAAEKSRRNEVNGAIVLAAIIGDGKTPAAKMLSAQGLTFQAAISALQTAQMTGNSSFSSSPSHNQTAAGQISGETKRKQNRAAVSANGPLQSKDNVQPSSETLTGRTPNIHTPVRDTAASPLIQSENTAQHPSHSTDTANESFKIADSLARFERRPPPRMSPDTATPTSASSVSSSQPSAFPPPPLPSQSTSRTVPYSTEPAGNSIAKAPNGAPPQNTGAIDAFRRPPPPDALHRQQTPSDVNGASPQRYTDTPPLPHSSLNSSGTAPRGSRRTENGYTAYARNSQNPDQDNSYTQSSFTPEDRSLPVSAPRESSSPSYSIRANQILENIPRHMRVGITQAVDVRIARSELQNLAKDIRSGEASQNHDLVAAKFMTVRLRAPDDAFYIEPASRETLWLEKNLGALGDEFASWRWRITSKQSGRGTLQLVASVTMIGRDGLVAETPLPDRLFDIRMSTNYAKMLGWWIGWIAAALLGGLMVRFGDDIMNIIKVIIENGTGSGL